MPAIHDIPLSSKTQEVLRRAGIREHSKLRSKAETSTCVLLASMDEAHVLEPGLRNLLRNPENTNRG